MTTALPTAASTALPAALLAVLPAAVPRPACCLVFAAITTGQPAALLAALSTVLTAVPSTALLIALYSLP